MQVASDKDVQEFYERQLSIFSKMAGGVAGVIAGAATGLPIAGALLSPFLSVSIERVGKDVIQRNLAPRQAMRTGALIALVMQEMKARTSRGEKLRDDGFFKIDGEAYSPADEVTEAAINAAMIAFEERKLPFIAHLFAAICFDPSIDRSTANFLMYLSSQLSFRSLVILKITNEIGGLELSPDTASTPQATIRSEALLAEFFSLAQLGLVHMKDNDNDEHSIAIFGHSNIEPKKMKLDALGELLFRLMKLDCISTDDISFRDALDLLALVTRRRGAALDGGKF